jgi:hypothetical protein
METNFVIYKTEKYLTIVDLLSLIQTSKYIKKTMTSLKTHIMNITKQEFHKLYNILNSPNTRSLNISANEVLDQVPLFKKIILKPAIYKDSMKHLLNNCNHQDKKENNICIICNYTLQVYNSHTHETQFPYSFSRMSNDASFIITIAMMLYH